MLSAIASAADGNSRQPAAMHKHIDLLQDMLLCSRHTMSLVSTVCLKQCVVMRHLFERERVCSVRLCS